MTCPYHKEGKSWAAGHHTGIDIVSTNRRVYGTCDGVVFRFSFDKSYGNFVVVRSKENGMFHWFCHLQTIFVKQGQNVTRGTTIGIMGNTGNSSGTHLHFEIRKESNKYDDTINPADYMRIPNTYGFYNSKNYDISELQKFVKGDYVKIPCKYTGASRADSSLVEIGNKQLWIYNSSLNKSMTEAKGVICFVDTYKLMVEVDATEPENRQFWIGFEGVKI